MKISSPLSNRNFNWRSEKRGTGEVVQCHWLQWRRNHNSIPQGGTCLVKEPFKKHHDLNFLQSHEKGSNLTDMSWLLFAFEEKKITNCVVSTVCLAQKSTVAPTSHKVHIFALWWRNEFKRSLQIVVENRTWKKFWPVGDLNPWPLRYLCSILPTELTSQLGAGQYVGSK